MAYITFEFNNLKLRIEKTDSEIEKLFEDLTKIKIEKGIKQQKTELVEEVKEKISDEKVKERKHPSIDELIDFIKRQSNLEFGSELIRKEFYPDLDNEKWRRTFSNIYQKIQKATKKIEEQEKGRFIKTKKGKLAYYRFEKENTPSLSDYETKTNGQIVNKLRLLVVYLSLVIQIKGNIFKAIQVKTRTGDRFDFENLDRVYHILALVHLIGESNEIFLDQSHIYLLRKDEIITSSYNVRELTGKELEHRVNELFSG